MLNKIIILQKLLVKNVIQRRLGKQNQKTKQTIVNELDINKNILQDPQEIVEGFNDYFSNIGPNKASNIVMANCNFETYVMYKKLSRSLLHFNLPL